MKRRGFLKTAAAGGLASLAGCTGSEWYANLMVVKEEYPVLALASIAEPGGLMQPATVNLIPYWESCEPDEEERNYAITVTNPDTQETEAQISYRHPCDPSRVSPTIEVIDGVYTVLVNRLDAEASRIGVAEYELQVTSNDQYRRVDGGGSS